MFHIKHILLSTQNTAVRSVQMCLHDAPDIIPMKHLTYKTSIMPLAMHAHITHHV